MLGLWEKMKLEEWNIGHVHARLRRAVTIRWADILGHDKTQL